MRGRQDTAVCVMPSAQRAEECAVVLEAIGIGYRLEESDGGWVVMVAAEDAARATRALAAYDEENRPRPPGQAPPAGYGRTWVGVAAMLALVAFFAVTGPRDAGSVWFDRGSASAERILGGEVWRTVTALTLHADPVHVLSNAVMGAVVITAVGWWVGPGVGIWLVLLAGAAGNALTALAYGAHHVSVGASTATFGAVGILAALQFAARRRRPWTRRRAWVAIGAGLALLGMLGTSPGTDVPAHLFGLLAGGALGVGAALALRRPPQRTVQWSLALAAAASVAGSWWLALATATHG
jgi:membrane associated rhomboid family serine protease